MTLSDLKRYGLANNTLCLLPAAQRSFWTDGWLVRMLVHPCISHQEPIRCRKADQVRFNWWVPIPEQHVKRILHPGAGSLVHDC